MGENSCFTWGLRLQGLMKEVVSFLFFEGGRFHWCVETLGPGGLKEGVKVHW